jgi:hypothetical protein
MDSSKRLKITSLIVLIAILGAIAIFLRGPHMSNSLKRIILPELETATGNKVIAQKIYINIFPLFIEAKNLKMFDEDGTRIFFAKRVKAYVDLAGLLDKDVTIRRLVIKEPELTIDRQKADGIMEHINAYLAQEGGSKVKVRVRAVEVQDSRTEYMDQETRTSISISGVSGEIITGKVQKIRTTTGKVTVAREGWPELSAEVSSALSLEKGTLRIDKISISSMGSELSGSGEIEKDVLRAKTGIKLAVKSVKDLFHLDGPGVGQLNARGDVTYRDHKLILDMKLSGSFYLETLMELLRVEEKVEGLVEVKGGIKGPLNDIAGSGTAVLRNGNLFEVEVDYLESGIAYADGVMNFTAGKGSLYNGTAKASASIQLPVVNSFTLDINFSDVDSRPLFSLIGWDPGVQPGKVTGTLNSSGRYFNPAGSFRFSSMSRGKDVLGRISGIEGFYSMTDTSLLTLSDVKLHSDKTTVTANGLVDVRRKSLDLECVLKTADVTDLTAPHYAELQGRGEFYGRVTGSFDDPIISGRVRMADSIIEGYLTGKLDADVTYKKDLFRTSEFVLSRGEEVHRIKGSIHFRKAAEIFELGGAEFDLKAVLSNADLKRFIGIFYPEFKAEGEFSSSFTLRGPADNPSIHGSATILKSVVYDVPVDSASFTVNYVNGELALSNAKLRKGKSHLQGDFVLLPDSTFRYKGFSDHLHISDLVTVPAKGDATFSLKSEGQGTFENPLIRIDANLKDGMLQGRSIGAGTFTASIREKNISVKGRLVDGKIAVDAKGRLEGELPWDATIDIQTGRYDFLVSSFLKDVPDDLILNLSGSVVMNGTKNRINASSTIKHMVLSMYGYSFANETEMRLELQERKFILSNVSLRSGDTVLRAKGDMTLGKEYNLSFEGSSALSPFKSLSSRLGILKGNAEFVMEISGDWDTPKIYGGMTLEEGTIGLKEFPHRIGSLSGYLYIDNDRVILQRLAGKVGGGDIDLSGVLYLQKFRFKRFSVEAKLNNISTAVSKDFSINYGGNILYKGTPSAQTISGEIAINNARYRERVEWKSWLLKAKAADKIKTEISDLENAVLNIKISGNNNMHIDNNVSRAVVSADMILRGTVYRPVLFGRLESREGTVYFRNNDFRIVHASADFSDPNRINPVIEIASETTVQGYKIKMNLEGQLDHFNMALSSDPPLKELDILALLTVGRTSGELKGLESGIGAGEATSFVTGKLQDVLEERIRSITGLDRLQIDPYISKNTGTVEPRVTISKRLMGDKVFVTYATPVGSVEEQIIKLEYLMGKNVSLIGIRDERGILGGDVRFRFEFK